jgi:hypothetical protein
MKYITLNAVHRDLRNNVCQRNDQLAEVVLANTEEDKLTYSSADVGEMEQKFGAVLLNVQICLKKRSDKEIC